MSKKQVQIFVEGKADKKFIEDYLLHIYNDLKIDIKEVIAIGGKDQLPLKKPIFELNYPEIENVIIFDTDSDHLSTTKEIQNKLSGLSFNIPVFLIPNDSNQGNLETLLENIINKDNLELFECWNNYINCLDSKKKEYTTPNKKAKIFAYLEALLDKSDSEKINVEKRNYLDTNHWDLNSTYLDPLKTFLMNLQ